MEQRYEDLVEDLAQQELSPEELRAVLDRLACDATAEVPTVGAVSEVTGVSPEVIGRILAQIRSEDLHEEFGKRLDEHDEKLKHLVHAPSPSELEGRRQMREIIAFLITCLILFGGLLLIVRAYIAWMP